MENTLIQLNEKSIDALNVVSSQAKSGQRVVFVSGNFNVLHPGHLRLLRFAAECGDFVVVGVLDHKSPGAIVPEELRLESLKAISWVNHSFLLHDRPESFIAQLKPSTVVKGKEFEDRVNPESEAVAAYGGKIVFGSGEFVFSSQDFLWSESQTQNLTSIKKPTDYPKRHHFTIEGLKSILDKFKGLRVTVVGDLIVDEYITCDPLGMSQEDPTIVVTPVFQEKFVGGAGIVAAHARGLGAGVNFFTIVGKDQTAEFAANKLEEHGVKFHFFEDDSRPTPLKQRFRASGKTLLRVSHLKQHDAPKSVSQSLFESAKKALSDSDLLIFSDFNYGCLPQSLVDELSSICKNANIPMVADSQSSSQIGDVSRFKDCLMLAPTEREARLAMRDFTSGLAVLAESLRNKTRSKHIAITLGAEGILVHSLPTENATESFTDQLPPFNTAPKDTAGAGDSYLACSSMALTVGSSVWESAYLGSLAAACQVGRIGNIPLTTRDLEKEIDMR